MTKSDDNKTTQDVSITDIIPQRAYNQKEIKQIVASAFCKKLR